MRGMQGVADQHHVAVRPVLVPDPGKIAPHRLVRDQRMAVERIGEYLLADRLRLLDGLVLEAVGLPGRRVAFDQERAHRRRVAIVMGVERRRDQSSQTSATAWQSVCWCHTRRICWSSAKPRRRIPSQSRGAPASSVRRRRRSGRIRRVRPTTGSWCRIAPQRRRRARAAAGWSAVRAGRSRRSRCRRSRRFAPRRLSVMFFQLSIRGVMASTVSGSSARRNSSACSENTTPNPQVAPSGFCSNRSICASG